LPPLPVWLTLNEPHEALLPQLAVQLITAFDEFVVTAASSVTAALIAREVGGAVTNKIEVGCGPIGGTTNSSKPCVLHPAKPQIRTVPRKSAACQYFIMPMDLLQNRKLIRYLSFSFS
jgi:hypothetical protein